MTNDPMPKGFTYFLSDGDMIKIGSSMRPHDRISTLQTGSARDLETLAIVPIDIADEFQTHQKFAHLRGRGEWFHATPELLEFIKVVASAKAGPRRGQKVKPPAKPRSPLYALDCALRRETDPTKRMQRELRMAMEKEGAPTEFKARQDMLMGLKPRVRVQAVTA